MAEKTRSHPQWERRVSVGWCDMRKQTPEILVRRNAGAAARRQLVLDQLYRPRTQTELQERLGMSRTGILHLLRRMARDGLIHPAEKIGTTQIWERGP